MYIVTQVKTKHHVAEATRKQANEFMTDPTLAVDGSVWLIKGEHDLTAELRNQELVDLYNDLNDSSLVKFQSKLDGAARTYPLLKKFAVNYDEFTLKNTQKTSKKPRKGVISLEAQDSIYACREGSKQAALVGALSKGATIKELVTACSKGNGGKKSWSETSVRSGIYWDINKLKGYGIRTELSPADDPRYFLVYPTGMLAPLPHTPRSKS